MIRDKDKGYRKLLREVGASKGARVAVGVMGAEAAVAAKGDVPGLTLADVATWMEFGTSDGHTPERSFIRAWVDEHRKDIERDLKRGAELVLEGKKTVHQVLELIGLKFQGAMQQRIADGIAPPNAPATIAAKGSSTPLVDSGQLRSGITYKVEAA